MNHKGVQTSSKINDEWRAKVTLHNKEVLKWYIECILKQLFPELTVVWREDTD
jgi:hypothetical protein